jgi:hypothetical protein
MTIPPFIHSENQALPSTPLTATGQVTTALVTRKLATSMMFRTTKFAHVVSAVGAAATLAGASYVLDIPFDSVGSDQIIDSSVVSRDIMDGTLRQDDFAADQLPAGLAGPAGPSDAYSSPYSSISVPWPQVGFQLTPVKTWTLPAGKYVLTAQVTGINSGSSPTPTSCRLNAESGVNIASGSVVVPSGDSTTTSASSSMVMQVRSSSP